MSETTQALQRTTYGAVFGRILFDKRRMAGKEQDEVAAVIGISQSTYSRIERGEVSVTLDMVVRIAAHFGASPSALIREADIAANALQKMGVEIVPDRPLRNGDVILALLSGAALGTLIAASTGKK